MVPALLLVYLLLLAATVPGAGFYHPAALAALTLAAVSLLLAYSWPAFGQAIARAAARLSPTAILLGGAGVLLGAAWVFHLPPTAVPKGVNAGLFPFRPQAVPLLIAAGALLQIAVRVGPRLMGPRDEGRGTRDEGRRPDSGPSPLAPRPSPLAGLGLLLPTAAVVSIGLSVLFDGGWFQQAPDLIAFGSGLRWAALGLGVAWLGVVVLSSLPAGGSRKQPGAAPAAPGGFDHGSRLTPHAAWAAPAAQGVFLLLVLVALLGQVALIASSPSPTIDVYTIIQLGALTLASGANPYDRQYPSPYTAETSPYGPEAYKPWINYYCYPPGVLLLTLPGALLGDVRYSYMLAHLGVVGLLLALGGYREARSSPEAAIGKRRAVESVVLLYLYYPRFLYALEMTWNDALLGLGAAGLAYFLDRPSSLAGRTDPAGGRKGVGRALCLSGLLTLKQYGILWLPYLWRRGVGGPRLVLAGLAGAGLICAPFILWSPGFKFFQDIVFNFQESGGRYDSLSFYAATHLWGDRNLGQWVPWAVYGVVTMVLLWRQPGALRAFGPAGTWLLASAVGLLWFFLFAKQCFINYQWLGSNVVLLALSLAVWREGSPTGEEIVKGLPST